MVVCNYHDPVPDSAQLLNLQRKYSDQKPILLAVGNIVFVQCIFITDPFPIFCRSVERQSHMVRIFMAIGLLDLPSIPNSNSLKGGKLYFHSSQLLHDCIFQWMKAPCPSPHSAKSPFLTSTTTKSFKWVPSLSLPTGYICIIYNCKCKMTVYYPTTTEKWRLILHHFFSDW